MLSTRISTRRSTWLTISTRRSAPFPPLFIQQGTGCTKKHAFIKTQLMIFGHTHHSYKILEILMKTFDTGQDQPVSIIN